MKIKDQESEMKNQYSFSRTNIPKKKKLSFSRMFKL